MTRPVLERMSPFFIVSNVGQSISFYRDMVGFQIWYQEPDEAPFFAVMRAYAKNRSRCAEGSPFPPRFVVARIGEPCS